MKLNIDTAELEAIIEFHRAMRIDALDSCEYEEAAEHKERWTELSNLLAKQPDITRKCRTA